MMFARAAPVFPVGDVNVAVRWYVEKLGFTPVHVNADLSGEANYAIVRLGDVEIHLLQNGFDGEPVRSPAEAMFTIRGSVGDLDDLCKRCVELGLGFLRELADQPWGARDFTVLDPDGNRIWIAASSRD